MPLIEWNNKMSVGVEEIDEQHKKLVDIVNELHDALKNNSYESELMKIFTELVDYTKCHFTKEELLMEKAGYEDLVNHKKQHLKFVDKLDRLRSRVYEGKKEISIELSTFLSNWLIGHILHSDKEYADSVVNSEWYEKHKKSA